MSAHHGSCDGGGISRGDVFGDPGSLCERSRDGLGRDFGRNARGFALATSRLFTEVDGSFRDATCLVGASLDLGEHSFELIVAVAEAEELGALGE